MRGRNGQFPASQEAGTLARHRDEGGLGEHSGHAVAFEKSDVQADAGFAEVEQQAESLGQWIVVLATDGPIGCEGRASKGRRPEDPEAEPVRVGARAEDVQARLLEHTPVELDDLHLDLNGVAAHVDDRAVDEFRFLPRAGQGRVACLLVCRDAVHGAGNGGVATSHFDSVGRRCRVALFPDHQRGAPCRLAGDDQSCRGRTWRLSRDGNAGHSFIGDGHALDALVDQKLLLCARIENQRPLELRAHSLGVCGIGGERPSGLGQCAYGDQRRTQQRRGARRAARRFAWRVGHVASFLDDRRDG
ncbi:hypothetical protein D9M72_374960 [compost metagenome]